MKKEIYDTIVKECKESKVIIVSKFRTNEQILEYYNYGHRIFGENRVQDLVEKEKALPKDIEWHFIGHLQKNKVKYIIPFISLIHSVDSIPLLNEIEKQATKINRIIDVLIQFNLAEEESKSGIHTIDEFKEMMKLNLPHVHIKGIMVIGPHVDDKNKINEIFLKAYKLKETLHTLYPQINELSMGMSQDYKIAIQNHSTYLRIGSMFF